MQEIIPDSRIFDTTSEWYRLAKEIFQEFSEHPARCGHHHHWIPCAIVAKLLIPDATAENYRKRADEIYPQKLVRMPISAHTLLHYYIWMAGRPEFKYSLRLGFEALYALGTRNDRFMDSLNESMKCQLPASVHKIIYRRQRIKRNRIPPEADGVPEPSQYLDRAAIQKECSMAWEAYKLANGPCSWPQFNTRFMRKFKQGRKNLKIKKPRKMRSHHVNNHIEKLESPG